MRQLNLLQSAATCYYKVQQLFYYKVRQVFLQSVTGITKCNSFITKCDRYYKVRQNNVCKNVRLRLEEESGNKINKIKINLSGMFMESLILFSLASHYVKKEKKPFKSH